MSFIEQRIQSKDNCAIIPRLCYHSHLYEENNKPEHHFEIQMGYFITFPKMT